METLFLKIEGIEGECSVLGYEKWLKINSYSIGINWVDAEDLVVSKELDVSSPQLALACAQGKQIDEILLVVTNRYSNAFSDSVSSDDGEDGEGITAFQPSTKTHESVKPLMLYTYSNCRITSTNVGGSTGDSVYENISISYERVEWKYASPEGLENNASMVVSRLGESTDVPMTRSREFKKNTAFIMMWMDPERPELEDICTTIKEVFHGYGIKALRADDIQHDDKITDVILDYIADSEYLIADLSGERPNVYYEVGHAHALGRKPFLYRRKDTLLHFDLSVHNVREYRNITDFRDMLSDRLKDLVI